MLLLLLNPFHSCLTLYDPMDYSPPGSSLYRILQASILEWVAMPSSRGSSWPRDLTPVSYVPCMAGGFSTTNATWEAPRLTVFRYKITVTITLENCFRKYLWKLFPKRDIVVVQLPSHVWFFMTPLTAVHQVSLSLTISRSCPSSCPFRWKCHSAISSSDSLFSFCPQSFPASGTSSELAVHLR